MELDEITITYELADDGDIITRLGVNGDIPVATQLGLLEMAKDTILRGDDG